MSNDSSLEGIRALLHRAQQKLHPTYPDVYEPRGTPSDLPDGSSCQLTRIALLKHPKRIGRPCRLVKARHRIRMTGGHDIQPGQVCVAVETADKGKGERFDGIHAVRARLPSDDTRNLYVARVQYVPGRQYRLMWNSRPDTAVENHDITFVGNIVGCYSNDKHSAPILTMFSN